MRNDLSLAVGVCTSSFTHTLRMRRELGITVFTRPEHWDIVFSFDNHKSTFRHTQVFHKPDLAASLGEIQTEFPVV